MRRRPAPKSGVAGFEVGSVASGVAAVAEASPISETRDCPSTDSVVVPVYNGAAGLLDLVERTGAALDQLGGA